MSEVDERGGAGRDARRGFASIDEAAVDLATLAGLFPAGVICEIMHPDGTMARLPELLRVKKEHGLRLVSIADLIEYRRKREKLVRKVAEATIPLVHGRWRSVRDEARKTVDRTSRTVTS